MTKINLAGATAELAKQFEIAGMTNKDANDWYYQEEKINQAFGLVGMKIYMSWYSTECDGFVFISYWSEKIGRSIILNSDAFESYKTLWELAGGLVSYNDEARALEKKLKKIRR